MPVSKTKLVFGCAFLMLALGGCAFQQKKVERELQHPGAVNCATADGDLRVLRSEKAGVVERVIEGVTAIYPASAVVGLITMTETTKLKVAIGEYDAAIDKRIAEIQAKCGGRWRNERPLA